MSDVAPTGGLWRVCVTREEDADAALSTALRGCGLQPVSCPVLVEAPPADPLALEAAARQLEHDDWVVCASVRGVRAITRARGGPWPAALRTAAVGAATARALVDAGVLRPPLTASADGAEALWAALAHADAWPGRRVLVPTTPGGRRVLIDRLLEAGAVVDAVEAYAMTPREPATIARDWAAASPDAVVIESARGAEVLAGAVGIEGLRAVSTVLAVGQTTAAALQRLGVSCLVPARADVTEIARMLADCRAAASPS